MNVLLISIPLGFLAQFLHWGPVLIFVLVRPRSWPRADSFDSCALQDSIQSTGRCSHDGLPRSIVHNALLSQHRQDSRPCKPSAVP